MSAWQWMNVYGERPVEDTLSALIFDNVFGRFPNLRVVVSEHGASGCRTSLAHMDKSRGMGRNGPWIGGKLGAAERDLPPPRARRALPRGRHPVDRREPRRRRRCLVMGSDFPHAEGLAEPADFVKLLDPLDAATKRRIMRTNAETLFNR